MGRRLVTKPKALARLSSPMTAWKSVTDLDWGLDCRLRHSAKRLMTKRRSMPRIQSPLVLRTRQRSSLMWRVTINAEAFILMFAEGRMGWGWQGRWGMVVAGK